MHTWLKPPRVLPKMLASLIRSRPHRRPSLEFSILTRFNSSCMRMSVPRSSSSSSMVTTALGGSSSKTARTETAVPAASMPNCANNTSCGSDRIRRATLLGQSAVQVQRVWCSIQRKRDERGHNTTLCLFGSIAPLHRYTNHHVSRNVASDSTSHVDLAPMKKPMREGPRHAQPTHHQIFSRVAANKVCAMMTAMPQHDR